MAISTSYGGMTRIRFGGFFPRVGKSRLCGRKVPLSGNRVRLAKVRSQGADPEVVAACGLSDDSNRFAEAARVNHKLSRNSVGLVQKTLTKTNHIFSLRKR